jgi:hypothetical protein
MMSTKEAEQIKLELQNCPLEHKDLMLIHARLDYMADNHNGHMWGYL